MDAALRLTRARAGSASVSEREDVATILATMRHIAIVGASDNPARDSQRIMSYLVKEGFDVMPVNPNAARVLDRACVATLEEIEGPIDTVVCFRRSSEILPIAQSAIAIGASHLWMQLGVVNQAAAELARGAGLKVVMNRCIMVDHRRSAED